MPRKVCTVCTHPRLAEINTALVGREQLQDIGASFGLSRQAVGRHRDHVIEMRGLPREATKGNDPASILESIVELEDELRLLLASARRTHDRKSQLQIIDKLTGLLEFRAKMSGAVKSEKRGTTPGAQEGFHGDLDTLIDRARRFPIKPS